MIATVLTGMVGLSIAKVTQLSINNLMSNKVALQAEQYANAESIVLRNTDYKSLKEKTKTTIANSNGYKSEIFLSSESDYNDRIKQRTATINIYKDDEKSPRYVLKQPLYSVEEETSSACQIVTGTNGVNFTANGNYKSITVIASSTFTPADGTWTGNATFNIVAGTATGTVTTNTRTDKGGSKGHYWGTYENVVNQKTIETKITKGSIVKVSIGSSSRHNTSTVTVILV